MKDYYTIYGSLVTNEWPNTIAKNASSSAAKDGTPFNAEMINDIWGGKIDLMNRAGLTPNGVTEAVGSSQFVDSLHYAGLSPGWVLHSAMDAAHLALHRAFALTGQVILISSYSALCDAVYCGDSLNATADCFYKVTDSGGSTRSTSGTYMKMPDARGLFLRGLGTNGGAIVPANSPTNSFDGGTTTTRYMNDAMQGHWHTVYWPTGATGGSSLYFGTSGTNTATGSNFVTAQTGVQSPITDGVNGTPRTDFETRPASLGMQIVITY